MFHYFANDPDVLQEVYSIYETAFNHSSLPSEAKNMPLVLLKENKDQKNALALALEEKAEESVKILFNFTNFFLELPLTRNL